MSLTTGTAMEISIQLRPSYYLIFWFCLYIPILGGGGSQVWGNWVLQRSRYRTANNIQLMSFKKRLPFKYCIKRIVIICPHFIKLFITNGRRSCLVGRVGGRLADHVSDPSSILGRWRRCPFFLVRIFSIWTLWTIKSFAYNFLHLFSLLPNWRL